MDAEHGVHETVRHTAGYDVLTANTSGEAALPERKP